MFISAVTGAATGHYLIFYTNSTVYNIKESDEIKSQHIQTQLLPWVMLDFVLSIIIGSVWNIVINPDCK
jgi:hypothetical protein